MSEEKTVEVTEKWFKSNGLLWKQTTVDGVPVWKECYPHGEFPFVTLDLKPDPWHTEAPTTAIVKVEKP